MLNVFRILVLLAPLLVSSAYAASFAVQSVAIDVLDERITFENPAGYCTLGSSAPEQALREVFIKNIGPNGRHKIVHIALSCAELDGLRAHMTEPEHWLQISLEGESGAFHKLPVAREKYLSRFSRDGQKLNSVELSKRAQANLTAPNSSISSPQATALGRDEKAAYLLVRAVINDGQSSRNSLSLSGVTLVKALPLMITVNELTSGPITARELQSIMEQSLVSLLRND